MTVGNHLNTFNPESPPLLLPHFYRKQLDPSFSLSRTIHQLLIQPNQRSQSNHHITETMAGHQNIDDTSSVPPSPELQSNGSSASLASLESPISPPLDDNVADSFVFAFDIDGVLVRGGKPIPEALEAMKVLNGENEYGVQM